MLVILGLVAAFLLAVGRRCVLPAAVRNLSGAARRRTARAGARGRTRGSTLARRRWRARRNLVACRAPHRAPRHCSSIRMAMASSSTSGPTSSTPLRAAGINVLLVEYPGYGRSGGPPTSAASPRRCSRPTIGSPGSARRCADASSVTAVAGWRRRRATRGAPAAGGTDPRVHVHQRGRHRARLSACPTGSSATDSTPRAVLDGIPAGRC